MSDSWVFSLIIPLLSASVGVLLKSAQAPYIARVGYLFGTLLWAVWSFYFGFLSSTYCWLAGTFSFILFAVTIVLDFPLDVTSVTEFAKRIILHLYVINCQGLFVLYNFDFKLVCFDNNQNLLAPATNFGNQPLTILAFFSFMATKTSHFSSVFSFCLVLLCQNSVPLPTTKKPNYSVLMSIFHLSYHFEP